MTEAELRALNRRKHVKALIAEKGEMASIQLFALFEERSLDSTATLELVQNAMARLREMKEAHICKWEKTDKGWRAVYALGPGEEPARPKRSEDDRRNQSRERMRANAAEIQRIVAKGHSREYTDLPMGFFGRAA